MYGNRAHSSSYRNLLPIATPEQRQVVRKCWRKLDGQHPAAIHQTREFVAEVHCALERSARLRKSIQSYWAGPALQRPIVVRLSGRAIATQKR